MNKNTTIALVCVLITVMFFNSRFYYENILRRPYPYDNPQVEQEKEPKQQSPEAKASDSPAVAPTTEERGPGQTTDTLLRQSPSEGAEPAGDTLAAPSIETDTIWVETDQLIAGISEKGGKIVSVRMKDYAYRKEQKAGTDTLIELVPAGGAGGLTLDKESLEQAHFEYEGDVEQIVIDGESEQTIGFAATTPSGNIVRREYTFKNGSYLIDMAVETANLEGRSLTVAWNAGITESELGIGGKGGQYNRRGAHLFDGSDVEKFQKKKEESIDRTGMYEWVGVSSKYFLIAFIGNRGRENDVEIKAFPDSITRAEPKTANLNYGFIWTRIGENAREEMRLYVGPMRIELLKEEGLQRVLYGGWRWFVRADKWFPWLCEMMLLMLIWLQGVFKDYGIAILLVTVVVKVITYPLSLSSMRSMARMKEVQPKITALRQKHKADPRKMNEALMELYRKEGINPFNPGCLPMFLQMPILISLFVVLRKAIELREASTVLVPWVKDLSQAEVLFRLPAALPGYGDNFALMPIIMAVLTFVQNKMTMKDPNQKAMVYVMPVVMLVLFNNFPAGLVMYWTFSSALGLVQQKLIEKARQKTLGVGRSDEQGKQRAVQSVGAKRR